MSIANLRVSVNGGALQSGGIDVASNAHIAFSAVSNVGWRQQRWEIYEYPEGWTAPAGWSTASDGTIFSSATTPPEFDLPANTVLWGTWAPRLLVDEQVDDDVSAIPGLLDESTMLTMLSPSGQRDLAAFETDQFCTSTTKHKKWVRTYQRNLRTLETFPVIAGGWRTVLDVNFAGATDPGLSADGTYEIANIGGWKRENASNDRVAMAIGAPGLTIQPKVSTYNLATRTAPLLWLPLSALNIPLLDWDTSFRVWIHVTGESHDVDNTDYVFCGIDSDSLVWSPGYAGSGTNGFNARFLLSGWRINGAEGGSSVTSGGGNWLTYPTGVLRVDIPKLASPIMAPMTVWSPTSAPWPLPSSPLLRPMAGYNGLIDPNNDRIEFANASALGPAAGLGIVVGAYAGSNNDHFSVTITRLRVDYRK